MSFRLWRGGKECGLRVNQDLTNRRLINGHRPAFIIVAVRPIYALPGENGLTVSYTLSYPNTPIGQQHFTVEMTDENYSKLISPARTFLSVRIAAIKSST